MIHDPCLAVDCFQQRFKPGRRILHGLELFALLRYIDRNADGVRHAPSAVEQRLDAIRYPSDSPVWPDDPTFVIKRSAGVQKSRQLFGGEPILGMNHLLNVVKR